MLADAAEAGLISSPDIRLATRHIFGLAEGLAGWFRKDGALGRVDTVADIAGFALRGIGADPELWGRLAQFLPAESERVRARSAARSSSSRTANAASGAR